MVEGQPVLGIQLPQTGQQFAREGGAGGLAALGKKRLGEELRPAKRR
jgi:hypothetical protein